MFMLAEKIVQYEKIIDLLSILKIFPSEMSRRMQRGILAGQFRNVDLEETPEEYRLDRKGDSNGKIRDEGRIVEVY